MTYYRGDYYRGDYYMRRGDPGFLSFLGGAMKAVGGFIPGVGGIVSGIGEKLAEKGAPKASTAIVKSGTAAALSSAAISAGKKMVGTALKHPVLTGIGAAGIGGAVAGGAAGALVKHLAGGGKKRRRMHATNTKALRRALRRAYAFEKIAMRTIKLVHPRKHGRFGGFKKPRKRIC